MPLPASNPTGFEDLAKGATVPTGFEDLAQSTSQTDQRPNDLMTGLKRGTGLAGRAVIEGLTALPVMAGNAAVQGGNNLDDFLAKHGIGTKGYSDPSYRLQQPGQTLEALLDKAGFPKPTGWLEKLSSAIEGGLAGSRVPTPTSAAPPANFVSPAEAHAQRMADLLQKSQGEGYVVPPSTSNPNTLNKGLETIAGKTSVAQNASATNQQVTNSLAKRAVGLNPDSELTPESLSAIRQEAGQAYEGIKQVGTIGTSGNYDKALDALESKYQGAAASFPDLARHDVSAEIDKLRVPSFTGESAIDATKVLRENADKAFRSGDTGMGQVYKGLSNNLENEIEQNLQERGGQYGDLLDAFRNARQTIAKTYTVESALNPSTGNVNARKLATAMKGTSYEPNELTTAANFAQAFPRAVEEPTHSMGVHHLDTYGTVLLGGLGEHFGGPFGLALGAALPATRIGTRAYLLSKMGQSGAVPKAVAKGVPSWLPGAVAGAANAQ